MTIISADQHSAVYWTSTFANFKVTAL